LISGIEVWNWRLKTPCLARNDRLHEERPPQKKVKIEHQPILEIPIGKKKARDICDVAHQRRNL
jgi:hypothetical protein